MKRGEYAPKQEGETHRRIDHDFVSAERTKLAESTAKGDANRLRALHFTIFKSMYRLEL